MSLPLEENWKYITVWWNTVHMRWCVDMIMDFSYQIITILGISVDDYFNDQDNILNSNHILSWLTDDLIVPWGYWHQESGKCLSLNTWWVAWNWEKLKNLISRFDIK